MKHHKLHDIAKFLAGLILGDFLGLWWFAANGAFPVSFLGMNFSADMILPGLIFDGALFIVLIYYGWHLGKMPRVRERTYLVVAGAIFTVVALAHLFRLITGSDLVLLGWDAPLWLSWIGLAVTAFLAYTSFHLASRR